MIYVCKFVCHFSTPLKSRSKECATMPAPTFLTKYTCENDNNLFFIRLYLWTTQATTPTSPPPSPCTSRAGCPPRWVTGDKEHIGWTPCSWFWFTAWIFLWQIQFFKFLYQLSNWYLRKSAIRSYTQGEGGGLPLKEFEKPLPSPAHRVAKCQFFYADHFCPTKFTPRKSA